MPTLTAAAFENFFELDESGRSSFLREKNAGGGAPRHVFISPALYVTPVQAPVLQDPPSPSPYVVNHKRRGGGNVRYKFDRCEVENFPFEGGDRDSSDTEEVGDNFLNEVADYEDEKGDDYDEKGGENQICQVVKEDAYNNGGRQSESRSFVSSQGEFFDANDGFSSDASFSNISSYNSKIESELYDTMLMLHNEIESRKNVEENLAMISNNWNQICVLMQQADLTFPLPPCGNIQLGNLGIDQFCQEIFVSRYVLEEIGRGLARAEAEEEAEVVLESKDQEILRLHDRVQYYETVNHEMSQRKFVEIARKRQERKRVRRRRLWGFIGLSITIGVSLAAYTYIPESTKYLPYSRSVDSSNASCIDPS